MGLFGQSAAKPGELMPGLEAEDAPPFAGFFMRLFALAIDGVALYAVAAFVAGSARPALLAFNPWLPYLGLLAGLSYFWLANGPVGRGRTLGKALLGLHVVGRDGVSLGWGPATRRAAIHCLAMFGLLNLGRLNASYYLLAWPAETRYAGLLFFSFFGLFCLTLAFALAISVGLHPQKRGWHDLWGGAFVTRDPTPASFRVAMATAPDLLTERKMANHVKMTLPLWLLAFATLGIGVARQMTRGDARLQVEHAARLSRQVLSEGALAVMPVIYPSTEMERSFEDVVRQARQAARLRNQAVPTTESLRLAMPGADGRAILLQIYARHGEFPKKGAQAPGFQKTMQSLREQSWPLWLDYRARWIKETGQPIPVARQFVAVVVEQAQAFVYGDARVVAIARGAAEPTSGTLTFVDDPASLGATNDRTTTATAATAAGTKTTATTTATTQARDAATTATR